MLKSTAKWVRCEAYVNVRQKWQPGNEQVKPMVENIERLSAAGANWDVV